MTYPALLSLLCVRVVSAPGVGDVVSCGAVVSGGYLGAVDAGAVDGAVYAYKMVDGANNQQEQCYGTFSSASNSFTRNTRIASVNGTKQTAPMSAGPGTIIVGGPAVQDIVTPGTMASGTIAGTVAVGESPVTGVSNGAMFYNEGGIIGAVLTEPNAVVITNSSGVPVVSTSVPNGIEATTQNTGDTTSAIATDQFVGNAISAFNATLGDVAFINIGTSGDTVPTNEGGFIQSGEVDFTGPFLISGSSQFYPPSGRLVGTSDTQTLSNKTLTAPGINGGVVTSATIGAGNSLGAVTMIIGSDTAGDLFYNSAGAMTRLPIGANDDFLAVTSGSPAWKTPTSAFALLSPLTTEGDILYYTGGGNARMGIGAAGTVLASNGSDPEWLPTSTPLLGGNSATSVNVGSIGAGSTVALTLTTTPNSLTATENIIVYETSNPSNWFSGAISGISGSVINVLVSAVGGTGTHADWSIQITPPQTANAALIGYSTTSQTIGAGQFSFTTQSGQFFPLQGQVLIMSQAAPTNQMVGVIVSYSGTTLVVEVPSTGVYGSGTFAAWSIYTVSAPGSRIGLYEMNGLQISFSPPAGVSVNAGRVRDSTDTIDLVLASTTVIDLSSTTSVVSVAMGGTFTASGSTTITGAGTTFTTDFASAGTLTDLNSQLSATGQSTVSFPSTFYDPSGGGGFLTATNVESVASNMSMTLQVELESGTRSFYRGAPLTSLETFGFLKQWYGIVLAFNPSTNTTGVFATSFTPSGTPDLPSGYTYFRVLGAAGMITTSNTAFFPGVTIIQPLAQVYTAAIQNGGLSVPRAVFCSTITPTALGINVSAVNNSTGKITFASNLFPAIAFGTVTSVILSGTVPAGLTTGRAYYFAQNSSTSGYLYTTYAAAVAGNVLGTGAVVPTATTTGWSFRYLSYGVVYNNGFVVDAPIGGTAGITTMGFDLNLSNPLSQSNVAISFVTYSNLFDNGGAQRGTWLQVGTPTVLSTTCIQTGAPAAYAPPSSLGSGTFAQQGTSAFTIQVIVWG